MSSALLTPQQCLLRCFPLGRGGFVWTLPPSDLTLSFPSSPAAFLHFCLKDGWLSQPACSAGLRRWAQHVQCGESLPFCAQSFSTWWKPFVLSVSWWGHLLTYVQGALGNTPSPSWGPAGHKPPVGSLTVSWCLVGGSAEEQNYKDEEYSRLGTRWCNKLWL